MLTLKLITEQTERVIAGLEKKHFTGAREAIAEVMEIDRQRRAAQTLLDKNLADAKKLAAEIGGLMKQGKKDEAEAVKAKVAEIKSANETLKADMENAVREIPHVDSVIGYASLTGGQFPLEIIPEDLRSKFSRGDCMLTAVFFDECSSSESTMEAIQQVRKVDVNVYQKIELGYSSSGDYYNVVGLPVCRLAEILREMAPELMGDTL